MRSMFRPLELFIGLRYTRAKRRNHFISFISAISMAGIMLGVVALITVLSVMNGFHKEIRERILGMASHATISALDGGLYDWREVMDLSRKHPRVVGQAPFVEVQSMLVNGRNVNGAMVRGVDPEMETAVSDVGQHMKVGGLEQLQEGEYRIILGRELAMILNARVGDKVTVVTPTVSITPMGTMPRLKRFTVSGIFEVGMGDYDRGVALVHLADAAKLLRLGEAVTGVRLKLDDLYQAPEVSNQLARQAQGVYMVSDWTRQHRNLFSALRMEKRMLGLLLLLIVAVAAFNIVSTLVMVVTDKQSDIAILRTLGFSPRSVMGVFIIQGATIGFIGTLLGIVGGIALATNVEEIVSGFEEFFGIEVLPSSVYYISKLPSDMHWSDVGLISITAFLITLLATLYPAWRAARVQPAEALRYE
jgi:lipoprotein-releasing system permease protein